MIALAARHYLRPDILARVDAMLSADAGNTLTAHDVPSEAAWLSLLWRLPIRGWEGRLWL